MKKTFIGIFILAVAATLAMTNQSDAKSADKDLTRRCQRRHQMKRQPGECRDLMGRGWGQNNRVKSHFDYLDTDKDGKLSRDEFMAPHKSRFEAADIDGDGNLTEEEFGNSWSQFKKKGHGKRQKDEK